MRLNRQSLKIAVAASALLFAAGAGLWLFAARWELFYSHTVMDAPTAEVSWYRWRSWLIKTMDAGLYFRLDLWEIGNPHFADRREPKVGMWSWGLQSAREDGLRIGFPYNLRPFVTNVSDGPSNSWAQVHSSRVFAIYLPWWPILLAASILPAVATIRHIRRGRRKAFNFCSQCGYDLACNTSGVCSECGAAIE